VTGRRLLAALVLLGASALLSWRLHGPRGAASSRRVAGLALEIEGDRGRDLLIDERRYELLETHDVLLRAYSVGGAEVVACVAVAGPDGKAVHPPRICYRGQGWKVEEREPASRELGGRRRTVSELVISRGVERQLVWAWYRVGGEETGSWWREQWLALVARVAGRDDRAALLRFSTPISGPISGPIGGPLADEGEAAARATLARFLSSCLPLLDEALAAAATAGEARREGTPAR